MRFLLVCWLAVYHIGHHRTVALPGSPIDYDALLLSNGPSAPDQSRKSGDDTTRVVETTSTTTSTTTTTVAPTTTVATTTTSATTVTSAAVTSAAVIATTGPGVKSAPHKKKQKNKSGSSGVGKSARSGTSKASKSLAVALYREFEPFKLFLQTRPPLSEPEKYSSQVRAKIEEDMKPKIDGICKGKASQPQNSGRMSTKDAIVPGEAITRGQFPWHAGIVSDNTYFCSGALIALHWVLTVASCVDMMSNFTIHLGMQSRYSFELGRLTLMADNKYTHKEYSAANLKNNIALLYLPYGGILLTNANYQQTFMLPIRLPTKADAENTFEEVTASVTGWGRYAEDSTSVDEKLKNYGMVIASNMDCAEVYGSSIIVSSTLCAVPTGNNKTSCGADIGAPLVYKESDNSWSLIGLLSFVAPTQCSQNAHPVGFTRVSSYLSWISNTANLQIR